MPATVVKLPRITVDLKGMTVKLKDDPSKSLQLVALRDAERRRAYKSRRIAGKQLELGQDFSEDDEAYCFLREYGFKWGNTVKKNKFAKPTLVEILDGLKGLVDRKLRQELKEQSAAEVALFVR